MTGSFPFQIEASTKFQRSYKLLLKRHYKSERQKLVFADAISQIVSRLSLNPYLSNSNPEPFPRRTSIQGVRRSMYSIINLSPYEMGVRASVVPWKVQALAYDMTLYYKDI